ncbi:MAG TPA: choice-of-anchor Q domain-containing protein [Anaerolineales bacterium]
MNAKPTAIIFRLVLGFSLLSGLLLGGVRPVSAAGTIFVNASALGANNGTSWGNAFTSLQSALAAASAGTEIWVAAGTYRPTGGGDRIATFSLKSGVAIYGGFAGTETLRSQRNWTLNVTILSGDIGTPGAASDNSFNVVTARGVDAVAVLDGFTITGGRADGTGYPRYLGGGMFNENSGTTLANLVFTANAARLGGGMYNMSSTPSLTAVTFSSNSAARSGGGMSNSDSSPVLGQVTFAGNSAGTYGGGMENSQDSNTTLSQVAFDSNTAGLGGGGMYNYLSSPVLGGVTFSANTADGGSISQGGAMYNSRSNPTLTNVTFSGNAASKSGGAMLNTGGSSPALTNVTVSGNSAAQAGGIHSYDSSPVIVNSILYGDAGGELFDEGTSASAVTYSIVQGGHTGTGNLDVNPLLDVLLPNGGFTQTRALKAASPAIDMGSDASCPAADQRGVSRPRASHCDMGAFEYDLVIFVKAGAAGLNNGISWANAFPSLQAGLAASAPGMQIWVAAGTYLPTPGTDRTISFALRNGVAVYGGFNGTELRLRQRNPTLNQAILSGDIGAAGSATDNTYHVVTGDLLDASAVLDGFTIRDGNASALDPYDRGAGMYLIDSSPKLVSLTFTANQAVGAGAGMYNYSSSPVITASAFLGNTSPTGSGAGMYNSYSSPVVTGVRFENNAAGLGGGMYNNLSNPGLLKVTFSANTATDGGGMYNYTSNPALRNMTFAGNQAAASGGAIYNNISAPALTNVTFSANLATGPDSKGAAVFDEASSPSFRNVTLSGNLAASGGIYHSGGSGGQIENSILWADGSVEVVVDSSVLPSTLMVYDSIIAAGCPAGALCTHVLDADPLLGPLASNGGPTQTMSLGVRSPAIDAGADLTCALLDQRGIKRPQGPHCDMGALEIRNSTATVISSAALDGWVLESTETSSLGGTLSSTEAFLLLGDDAARRQYRAVLSFNTSGLPAGAIITSVTLKIRLAETVGTDPFGTLQYILGDLRKGYFGSADALELQDFQAPLTLGSVFVIKNTPDAGGWHSAGLAALRFPSINRSGLTQIRLRFKLDDDNDAVADYLKFYSGNAGVLSVRPRLVITYYLP